jgi:hypothetical protein
MSLFTPHMPLPCSACGAALPAALGLRCTAPSPGRGRATEEGRKAVGGGPVFAAGAGAGARAGGGLNGSTLIVAPQHVLQRGVTTACVVCACGRGQSPAMQLQSCRRRLLALVLHLQQCHTWRLNSATAACSHAPGRAKSRRPASAAAAPVN